MRQISLGPYVVVIDGGSLVVTGPDSDVSRHAEGLLFDLLGTSEGARLVGQARLGPGTATGLRALEELAKRMSLAFEATPPRPSSVATQGRSLDYDDDHARIRALNLPKIYTRTITEFEGMCAALVFDGVVDDSEIQMLRRWMAAKAEFMEAWPLCDVKDLLDHALRDGVVDDAERRDLLGLLDSIGASAENCGKAAESIFDVDAAIEFPRRSFLFTGRLALGTRKEAEAAVVARRGRAAQSVSQKLDYLVVGDLGTDAWQYSRYGRKIEAVMENKRAGLTSVIVREATFVAALDGCRPQSDT